MTRGVKVAPDFWLKACPHHFVLSAAKGLFRHVFDLFCHT